MTSTPPSTKDRPMGNSSSPPQVVEMTTSDVETSVASSRTTDGGSVSTSSATTARNQTHQVLDHGLTPNGDHSREKAAQKELDDILQDLDAVKASLGALSRLRFVKKRSLKKKLEKLERKKIDTVMMNGIKECNESLQSIKNQLELHTHALGYLYNVVEATNPWKSKLPNPNPPRPEGLQLATSP